MITIRFLTSALFALFLLPGCSRNGDTSARPWSARIAGSFLAAHPDSIVYEDEAKSRKWNYEQGLMMEAMYQMWKHTKDTAYIRYILKNLDYYVTDEGTIETYKLEDFNLDNIAPGKSLIRAFEFTGKEKYMQAAGLLMRQLERQPRTPSGGFWHKKIYPDQMWLDGLYMAQPFYTAYVKTMKDTLALADITRQFELIRSHSRDRTTGLYFHGWDESRRQRWADPATGLSPNLWGRSIGWLSMALVDVLEILPEGSSKAGLQSMFNDLAESVWNARDTQTNLWYQVVNRPGEPGNYLEASASAMFAYAFAKGARLGYLPPEFGERARLAFQGIMTDLVTIDGEQVHLNHVCKVSGLGGDPYRDGSYEYYVGEPQRTDDFKGYGPFLLAAIEIERTKQ